MNQIKKAEREMLIEIKRQIDIYYSCVALALSREWGWGKFRIAQVFEETQKAWDECAETSKLSMVQMLDEETGIELRNEENKSWRDMCFLNNEHPANKRPMSPAQFYYMRKQQVKWMGTSVFACILLGLHRKYGFGAERLMRVVAQVVEIREQYGFDNQALVDECKKETGISVRDKQEVI